MSGHRPPPGVEEATALARVGAAAGDGDADRLIEALDAAEAAGVTPDDLEEIVLQTYLFAGFPRAINAFYTYQGWTSREGRSRGRLVVEPDDPDLWRRRGEDLCRRVYGESFEALQKRLARLHPMLADWTLMDGYGKALSRPGPDAARREAAAVGTLVAVAAERQLVSHLVGALRTGVPRPALETAARTVAAERGREDLVERLLESIGDEAGPAEMELG